jgi:hypothetical protein
MSDDPKYRNSTRHDLSGSARRRLGLALGLLAVLLVVIVAVAVLVAFGEITLR